MKKVTYIVLLLFLLGLYFRVELNGLYKGYPGNVKAMDPMHHTLNAEWIAESGHYGTMPFYLAQGYENVMDYLPPFLYLSTAAMTILSGIPAWDTMYFLTCLFSALVIPLLYIITKRVFDSEYIGLIAAGLYVLPIPVATWLYGLNVGMWILVASMTMALAALWSLYEYWRKPRTWAALVLGLSVTGTLLLHFPETITILPFVAVVMLLKARDMDKRVWLKDMGLAIALPLVSLILFSPVLYFLLTSEHYHGMNKPLEIGFIDISKTTNYPFAKITDFPELILLVGLVGLVYLFINREKYWFWLAASIYSLSWIFVLPSYINKFDYVIRQRFMAPFFVLPIVAFGVYVIWREIKKRTTLPDFKTTSIIVVAIAVLAGVLLMGPSSGEIITSERFDALRWLQENTPKDSVVFFLDGFYQKSGLYSKRVSYQVYPEKLKEALIEYYQNQRVTTKYSDIDWISFWVHGPHKDRYFDFDLEFYEPRDKNVDMTKFDYVVMEDSGQLTEFNKAVRNLLINSGFSIVYNKNNIYIMEAE